MNKTIFLLILIILLSFALRLFYIGKIPNGFYSDEAAYGYNAYSILKTGRDEYGNFFPLAFKSFGDYKTPFYVYFLIPFVGIFGLNEVSIRLSSAVLSIGSIFLIYRLAKKLFKSDSVALMSAFIASISPFSLQFGRMAHENNLVVFLVLLGLLFFVKSLENSSYIFYSAIVFVMSIYSYHDARVFTPLLVFTLVIIYRTQLIKFKKKLLLAVLLSIILLSPFVNLLRTDAFWSRPKFTAFFSDAGTILNINEARGEDIKALFFSPVLFHNKLILYGLDFISNYMKHFTFDFLFISGDPVKIYNTVGNGLLYLISGPFLLLGLYILLSKESKYKWFVFSWLVVTPVTSSLTRFVPSASRILSVMPVLSILIAIGLIYCITRISQLKFKHLYITILSCIFVFNIAYYLHYYYFNTQIRFAKEWHYGMREIISKVKEVQSNYSQVWFSKSAWGYIYPLFYLAYPPDKYQHQAELSSLNEYGFGWISGFDKYVFADIPDKTHRSLGTLYIGSADDFPDIKKPLYTVNYPDGQVAFYLADKNSF